jgi:hypothetical protein
MMMIVQMEVEVGVEAAIVIMMNPMKLQNIWLHQHFLKVMLLKTVACHPKDDVSVDAILNMLLVVEALPHIIISPKMRAVKDVNAVTLRDQ